MGGKHSQLVTDYLEYEHFDDATKKAIKRSFEKACRGQEEQVLADLQSGDERDRGRNESLILGSLSEELQAQAYFHIYGSLLQTSALLCELGRAASKEFPHAPRMRRATSSGSRSQTALPSPFQAAIVAAVGRHTAGNGQIIAQPTTAPAIVAIRSGFAQVSGTTPSGTAFNRQLGPGYVLELALVHAEEATLCMHDSNEVVTLDRHSLQLKAVGDGACVYGVLTRDTLTAIVSSKFAPIMASWKAAEQVVVGRREQEAARRKEADRNQLARQLCSRAASNDVAGVRALVSQGVDVNQCVDSAGTAGWTPLIAACSRQSMDTLRALLDAGADVGIGDAHGTTPLHAVAASGWVDGFRVMASSAPELMCLSSKAHDTPVHVAAANGQCDLLEAMTTLAAERDIILPVHQRNDAGYTPVQLATTLDARRVLKPKTDKGGAALYR